MPQPPKKPSRLKGVDPKAAEPSKPKILVYGLPGTTTTRVSLDFPNVYYIDTEGDAELKHYTDKLKASDGRYFGPDRNRSISTKSSTSSRRWRRNSTYTTRW